MRRCAVKFISLQVHSTCFGRHTPIIRSTVSTVSTAIGTIHSQSQIVSVTSSQCSLARTSRICWLFRRILRCTEQ